MKIMSTLAHCGNKMVEIVRDILVPEDLKVRKLMALPPETMFVLLPKSPVYMQDVYVLFDYGNKVVKLVVKKIKYKNNWNLRKRIAFYLYEEILNITSDMTLLDEIPPLLVPMPMSLSEKRKRGFNQCEEICKEIHKLAGKSLDVSFNTLKKIRETKRQTELGRNERTENLKNSMAADGKAVRGRICFVLDDVYTTGASFAEAKRALRVAGVNRIIGLFIAH